MLAVAFRHCAAPLVFFLGRRVALRFVARLAGMVMLVVAPALLVHAAAAHRKFIPVRRLPGGAPGSVGRVRQLGLEAPRVRNIRFALENAELLLVGLLGFIVPPRLEIRAN
jgi:hypothetical protein